MPVPVSTTHSAIFQSFMRKSDIPWCIYLADEEIVGELPDGSEYQRIREISEGLIRLNLKCTMNTSVRADSLYNPKKGREKNKEMIGAWKLFQQAGLERLFIGVESGSEEQLKRYGKGTTPKQNIIAIRIATALGIKIRVGFVMFDPLMEDRQDLLYNMQFLAREDVIMKKMNPWLSEERILDILEEREGDLSSYLKHEPVFLFVSYLFTGLEVFVKAPYYLKVRLTEAEKHISLLGTYDWELGKVKTAYINNDIGELQSAFAKWVDKNYSLTYTLKSLAKSAEKEERRFLYDKVFEYRKLLYEMAFCILMRDDPVFEGNTIQLAEKYRINLDVNTVDLMVQWEKNIMNPFISKLIHEMAKYIDSQAKRDLILQVVKERSQILLSA